MGFIGQDTIVFIRKQGSHYHLQNCDALSLIVKDDPYYGVEFKDIDKRLYHPCACISDKKRK